MRWNGTVMHWSRKAWLCNRRTNS